MSQAPEFARANPQKGDCVDSSSESDSPLSDGGAAIVAEGAKRAKFWYLEVPINCKTNPAFEHAR